MSLISLRRQSGRRRHRRAYFDETQAIIDATDFEDVIVLDDVDANAQRPARIYESSDDEQDDENSVDTIPNKRPCLDNEPTTSNVDESEETCLICFEAYTSSGPHRLVCLACGHVFGESCITKWIRAEKNPTCPNCKKKAKLKDIRPIYARSLKMIDTSELEFVNAAKRILQTENAQLKSDLAQCRLNWQKEQDECERLRQRLLTTIGCISSTQSACTNNRAPQLIHIAEAPTPNKMSVERSFVLDISRDESCRAMDYSSRHSTLIITTQQRQGIFRPFGLKKLDIRQERAALEYIPVHDGRPRDCVVSPIDTSLVLSAGEDKCMCVTNIADNCVVQRLSLPNICWSCCWQSEYNVYAGLINGRVLLFDRRMLSDDSGAIVDVTGGANRLPIIAVHALNNADYTGVMVTNLKQCFFYDTTQLDQVTPHMLVDDEGISSFSYSGDQFSLTFRPGRTHPTVMHNLYQLQRDRFHSRTGTIISARDCGTWQTSCSAQSLITRNSLFNSQSSSSLCLAAFDETNGSLIVHDWSAKSDTCVPLTDADRKVVQLKSIDVEDGRQMLLALSERRLHRFDLRHQ